MSKPQRHFLLKFLEWDLRAVIAGLIALAVIIGWSYAQDSTVVNFDFGGASGSNVAGGAVKVAGGASLYPQQGPDGIVFGWTSADVQEYNDDSVSNLLRKDYNAGQNVNTFRVSGLLQGTYHFTFTVGKRQDTLATNVQVVGSSSTSLTVTDDWGTKTTTHEVEADGDAVNFQFSSANGSDPWGINGLLIATTEIEPLPESFAITLTPATASFKAGNSTNVSVGVAPDDEYSYEVDLSASNLPAGMTAAFSPANVATLPGSSDLTISTSADLAPAVYQVTIRGEGVGDPEAVVKTAALTITVLAKDKEEEEEEDEEIDDEESAKKGFTIVDKYSSNFQRDGMLSEAEVDQLLGISDEFSSFPVFPSLPVPDNRLEMALQTLVAMGIIDLTIDNAPRGIKDDGVPNNMWEQLIETVFKPVQ